METSDTLNALRRRLPVIAVIVTFAVALAWITTPGPAPPAKHTATATVSAHAGPTRSTALVLEPVTGDIVAGLVTSGEVPVRAKAKLAFKGTPEALAGQVQAKPDKSGTVKISTTQSTKKGAIAVADTFATEVIGYLQERQDQQVKVATDDVKQQIAKLQARATDLDKQLNGASPADAIRIKADRLSVSAQITPLQQRLQQLNDFRGPGFAPLTRVGGVSAAPVASGFGPPSGHLLRSAIGALLGLVLGAGLALIMDRLDPTLRSKRQAELAFGFPVIAEIPELSRRRRRSAGVITASAPRSGAAEAYRNLRTAISLMSIPAQGVNGDGNGHGHWAPDAPYPPSPHQVPVSHVSDSAESPRTVIVVTSAGPSDGKTVSAVNLAASFGEAGNSVLLVGADLRRPALHRYFDLPEGAESVGTTADSREDRPLRDYVRSTAIPGLSLLPGGSQTHPPWVLSAQQERLAACRSLANVIVVDTPPLLVANDAVEFMRAADAVILVGRCGHTTADAAERVSERVRRLGMPVMGVVMIGLTSLPRSYRRYYDDDAKHGSKGEQRALVPTTAFDEPDTAASNLPPEPPAAAEVPDRAAMSHRPPLSAEAQLPDRPVAPSRREPPVEAEVPDLPLSSNLPEPPAEARMPDLPVSSNAPEPPAPVDAEVPETTLWSRPEPSGEAEKPDRPVTRRTIWRR